MATVGTAAQTFTSQRNCVVTLGGIKATGTTQALLSQGFVIGSWQATGLTATGLTAELYGSNDGTNFYALESASHSSDGLFGLITDPGPGFSNLVPLYYQWTIGGTYGSGTLVITVLMASTFG